MPSVSSPAGLTKHNASTIFLRVPREDWAAVTIGAKTEFRMPGVVPRQYKPPTPVLAYAQNRGGFQASKLMLLEHVRVEPVGMIEDDALEREGFSDLAHFRRYWMKRTKKRFNVMQMVQVFTVRPVDHHDYDYLGRILLSRLYGEHL